MDLLSNLFQSVLPDFKSLVYAVLGFVGTLLLSSFRSRRIGVAWTAVFQAIRPTVGAPVAAKVSVLVNGSEALNLHSCQINVVNESGRDVENMDLLVRFYSPFKIVEGTAGLKSSGKNLLLSAAFTKTVEAVVAMPEEKKSSAPANEYIWTCREYHVPALNRGDSAVFTFWINSESASAVPVVLVSSEKAGVKMISRKADIRSLDMAQLKQTIVLGVPLALLFALGMSRTGLGPLSLALACVAGGILCGAFGTSLRALFRWGNRIL